MTANDNITNVAPKPEQFDWITLNKDMGKKYGDETLAEKFQRKFGANPFVPIGCLGTAGALTYGLYCFRSNQHRKSQMMMRLRIVAQGFTVVALVVGIIAGAK